MNARQVQPRGLPWLVLGGLILGLFIAGYGLWQWAQANAEANRAQKSDAKWTALSLQLAQLTHQLEVAKTRSPKQDALRESIAKITTLLSEPEFAQSLDVQPGVESLLRRIQDRIDQPVGELPPGERPPSFREIVPHALAIQGRVESAHDKISPELEAKGDVARRLSAQIWLWFGAGGLLLTAPALAYFLLSRSLDNHDAALRAKWNEQRAPAQQQADAALAALKQQSDRDRLAAAQWERRLKQYAQAVDNTAMILWVVNAEGQFTLREGLGLLECGQTAGQGVGQHFSEVTAGRPGSAEHMKRALAGECFAAESREGDRWYHTLFNPIRNADGAIVAVSGVSTNITQQKVAESKALHEEGLRQATRLKSEFMANMSHELRTPMNGIVGMVGLLGDTSLSAEQQGMLEVIQSSTDSLLRTVNDIIDLSKLETGKVQLGQTEFIPAEVIHDVLRQHSGAAQRKGLELIADLDGATHSTVLGDPDRFRQVVANLVDNAVKYTREGHALVQVRSAAREDGKVHFDVAISDTGVGIEADRLATLLQPYNSQSGKLTRKVGDVGFGLALAKMVVDLMEGSLGIQSEPGKGTTVTFIVGLALKTLGALPGSEGQPFSGLRMLVVDDNEVVRGLLALRLAGWGADVDVARTGQDAVLSCFERHEKQALYDLVLIDRYMPTLDGARLANRIRGEAPLSHLPLVLLTPVGAPLEEAQRSLFNQEILKPLEDASLLKVLRDVLEQPMRKRAAPAKPVVASSPSTPPLPTDPLRVLVADDNAVNQAVCRKMVEKLGHTVKVVSNGEEVLVAIAKEPFDVIFMDCQMPIIDGYEATRRIRSAQATWSDVWVIAATANASFADRENCVASGMDDFIAKPLRFASVEDGLKKFLAERNRTTAAV